MILDKVLQNREDKRQGIVKAIPSSLDRFNTLWAGIMKEDYIAITGTTNSGKTTLMKHIAVIEPIEYAIKKNLDLKILYFGLEESEDQFNYTILSYLINKRFGKRYNIIDFLSIKNELPDYVIDMIRAVQDEFDMFKSYIIYHDETLNPYGIYHTIREFAKTRGEFIKDKPEDEHWSHYRPNNPNEFIIVIVDHISLLQPETKHNNKLDEAMRDLSVYLRQYVSKKFKYAVIAVHQQMSESEDLDHIKSKRWMPTLQGFGDNKRIGRDYLTVIGVGNPARYGIKNHEGYEIREFDGYLRFVSILKQRYGKVPDRELPIFMDGKCNFITTMPYPNQCQEIKEMIKTIDDD